MTLHLVDASGLVHRAFHAIRALTNSQGQPTNAIFGLASMLKKFVAESSPTHCAVVLDVGRETFRNRMYDLYKANRPETDPALAAQFEYVPKLAGAMGFPVLALPDYEADDIIATLAARAVDAGMNVVVHSGDKDLLQLVGPGITVYDPMKEKTYDRQAVFEKMGVYPEFVVDYLALLGDSSDNVPGVRGIGAKGAADLINRFGGLEDIVKSIDLAPPRARAALSEHVEDARLSKRLVTLEFAAPIETGPQDLKMNAPDLEALRALYRKLEFRKMLAELNSAHPEKPGIDVSTSESDGFMADLFSTESGEPASNNAEVEVVKDSEISACLKKLAGTPVDIVFCGWPDPVAAIMDRNGHCHVMALDDVIEQAPEVFMDVLDNWTGSGFKELSRKMAAVGMTPAAPRFDPVLAAYLTDAGQGHFLLSEVIENTTGKAVPADEDTSPAALLAKTVGQREACFILREKVLSLKLDYLLEQVEIPLAGLLGRMEHKGILVDREALSSLSRSLGDDMRSIERRIMDEAGVVFNPMSPKQLAEVLFVKLGLPTGKKKSSGYSTDVKVLQELVDLHPVPGLILEYRTLAKLKGTYADALYNLVSESDGRIHTTFNQTVTATGRLSSSDPNLQNIPVRTEAGRKIRHAFRAPENRRFVSADYSQIELRVLAHFANDPFLADAFRNKRDIHAETARRIYDLPADGDGSTVTSEMRRVAKIVNFGLLYGMGPFRLAGDLKISQKEARQIIDDYFNAFPGIRDFLDSTVESTRASGFSTTMFGRRRGIADINSPNHQIRTAAERMALNMPVQGTAADIIKIAMVNLDRRLRAENVAAEIVLQVHDELVLEVDIDEVERTKSILIDEMEKAAVLGVPLVAEPGEGTWWDELH